MDPDGQVDRTFAQARAWLRRNRDKRFFLFLHTFQVHTPYAPPARYTDLFSEHDGVAIDEHAPSHLRWQAEYDREIRYVDDELRLLFETIDALGLRDDTVFILTSDHGEAFLEHGMLEHGSRLDEEVVRVPLLLWGRGVPAALRVKATVSHLDLMPTILDMMELPAPPGIQGWSLVPLLEGDAGAPFATRPVYSESRGTLALGPDRSTLAFHPPAFLVRVGDRKLTRYRNGAGGHRYEYYDLATDPEERSDLYAARPEEARDLFQLLDRYEESNLSLRAELDRGESPESQAVELDPRQEEKLRALGYLR
jgi:arylsulfatase